MCFFFRLSMAHRKKHKIDDNTKYRNKWFSLSILKDAREAKVLLEEPNTRGLQQHTRSTILKRREKKHKLPKIYYRTLESGDWR